MVKLLLDKGAEVNQRSNDGFTALLTAAMSGQEAIVALLLERKANVDARGPYGRTPLWHAVHKKHNAVVIRLLRYGANAGIGDNSGKTPQQVAKALRLDLAELLTQWGSEKAYAETAKLLQSSATEADKANSIDMTLRLADRNLHRDVFQFFWRMNAARPAIQSGGTGPSRAQAWPAPGVAGPPRSPSYIMPSLANPPPGPSRLAPRAPNPSLIQAQPQPQPAPGRRAFWRRIIDQ
jgi:hypothetical protein